jgi:hypothetical protein
MCCNRRSVRVGQVSFVHGPQSIGQKIILLTRVLAVGYSVAADTSLAGPLLSVDNHDDELISRKCVKKCSKLVALGGDVLYLAVFFGEAVVGLAAACG